MSDEVVVLHGTGVLDEFRRLDENVAELIDASRAPGTRRVYDTQWGRFAAWCSSTGQVADVPTDPLVVARYFGHLVQRQVSASLIHQAAAAIADAHTQKGCLPPTEHPQVKRALQGARRTLGVAPRRQATPLSPKDLRDKILPLVPSTLAGLRDLVILSFGLASGLRRSELASLQLHQLDRTENGYVIRLGRTKSDQEGVGHARGVTYGDYEDVCPVRTLDRWIALTPGTGHVLRSITRSGQVSKRGISGARVSQIIKWYARQARLRGKYSGHSLRSGYGTAAARSGKSPLEIQRHLGHQDPKSSARYIRDVEVEMSTATKGIGL